MRRNIFFAIVLAVGFWWGIRHLMSKILFQPVMHTFFEDVPMWTAEEILENKQQLEEWKRAWEKKGWKTRVLSSEDIDSKKFNVKLLMQDIPLGTNKIYDYNCYIRHFAMASVGGGWMSDYDVIPLKLTPRVLPNGGLFTIHEHAVPSLVSGSQKEWERVARAISDVGKSMAGKTDLFSDMMSFQALPLTFFVHSVSVIGYNEKTGSILFEENYSKSLCDILQSNDAVHLSHAAMSRYKFPKASRAKVYKELTEKISRECKDL